MPKVLLAIDIEMNFVRLITGYNSSLHAKFLSYVSVVQTYGFFNMLGALQRKSYLNIT